MRSRRTKAAAGAESGFTLVEMMVVCAVLAPLLFVALSATRTVARSVNAVEAKAVATTKAGTICRQVADILQPASLTSLRVRDATGWVAPLDRIPYTSIRFQPADSIGAGGAITLGPRVELGFALKRGESGNGRDDDGNGLIDEGNVFLVTGNGTRIDIAGGVEVFLLEKQDRTLTITIRTGARDGEHGMQRATHQMTIFLRNN